MKKSNLPILLILLIGITVLISCSSDDKEPTYYYSEYGIKDCSTLESLISKYNSGDKTFQDIKNAWTEINQLNGKFIKSGTGLSESYLKDHLIQNNVTPKEADDIMEKLKSKGNGILFFNDNFYCVIADYFERD
jgi:hypothetical protein